LGGLKRDSGTGDNPEGSTRSVPKRPPIRTRCNPSIRPPSPRPLTHTRRNRTGTVAQGLMEPLVWLMPGFKSIRSAATTLAGIELMHTIRKGQLPPTDEVRPPQQF
jgi:hypothetical protein